MSALDSILVIWSYTSYYLSERQFAHYKLGNIIIPLKCCVRIQKDKVYESAL